MVDAVNAIEWLIDPPRERSIQICGATIKLLEVWGTAEPTIMAHRDLCFLPGTSTAGLRAWCLAMHRCHNCPLYLRWHRGGSMGPYLGLWEPIGGTCVGIFMMHYFNNKPMEILK